VCNKCEQLASEPNPRDIDRKLSFTLTQIPPELYTKKHTSDLFLNPCVHRLSHHKINDNRNCTGCG